MTRVALVLALAGCHAVLGIDELEPDRDRDSVPDSEDRCPDFDDAIDEDGDQIPDACDNCPETPNPDQANADAHAGDEAGDACDPDTTAGTCVVHTRAAFDAFNRTDLGDWAPGDGAWSVAGGALVQSMIADDCFAHLPRVRLPNTVARVRARIRELLDDPGAGRDVRVATMANPQGTNLGSGYYCFADARGSNHSFSLKKRQSSGLEDTLDTSPVSGQFAAGGTLLIVAESAPDAQRCDVVQANPAAAAQQPVAAMDSDLRAGGEVLLLTRQAAVEFLAVDILTAAGPCP